jgi:type IV secretory pathway component VirB8
VTTGDDRLRAAITRRKQQARSEDPRPYDDSWGWWVEERIARLEKGQTWLIRIAIGALIAEIIRIITVATGLGG